jgi:hypothetical protein
VGKKGLLEPSFSANDGPLKREMESNPSYAGTKKVDLEYLVPSMSQSETPMTHGTTSKIRATSATDEGKTGRTSLGNQLE